MGTSQEPCTSSQADGKDAKYSESGMMELIPGQRPTDYEEADNDSVSEVAFLDTPKLPPKSNLKSLYRLTEAKVQKLCVKMGDTRREHSISDYETEGLSTSEGYSADEFEDAGQDDTVIRVSPNKSEGDRAQESDGPIGSTVAEALYAPVQSNMFRVSDVASNTSADFPEVMPRVAQLSASGRALIKEYFEEATPVRLPPGHSTLALNEGQVSHMLKVLADEAVKSSLKAMENLVHQASRLNLGQQTSTAFGMPMSRRPSSRGSDIGSQSGFSSGHASDTSGAIKSNDDLGSIGYVYEHSDLESQRITLPPAGPSGSRHADLASPKVSTRVDSPGAQTLAGLKAEAVSEKVRSSCRKKQRKAPARSGGGNRHHVTRACKVMKEAYLKGMEWTRTFVSGPVDPRWNPYKFYCQICKGNISIYGRGAREILRHHATERHLRKDQRWRYEHPSTEDPITKQVKHYVRGKDGRLLTPYELQLELPKFIGVELIDIGEKLPFYDEYLQGTDYMASSSENRVRVQISVLGNYLRSYGDISTLREFWRDIGVVVNHQSLFTNFDWSKERLSVSKFV